MSEVNSNRSERPRRTAEDDVRDWVNGGGSWALGAVVLFLVVWFLFYAFAS